MEAIRQSFSFFLEYQGLTLTKLTIIQEDMNGTLHLVSKCTLLTCYQKGRELSAEKCVSDIHQRIGQFHWTGLNGFTSIYFSKLRCRYMYFGKMLKVFNFLMYQPSIKDPLHTMHILGCCEEYNYLKNILRKFIQQNFMKTGKYKRYLILTSELFKYYF